MAITTASIAISPTTAVPGQQINVTLTVNADASGATIAAIQPLTTPSGANNQAVAMANGQPPLLPGQVNSVPISGSRSFSWSDVAHAPQPGNPPSNPSSFQYTIGATVYDTAGTVVAATGATLTVNAPAH